MYQLSFINVCLCKRSFHGAIERYSISHTVVVIFSTPAQDFKIFVAVLMKLLRDRGQKSL